MQIEMQYENRKLNKKYKKSTENSVDLIERIIREVTPKHLSIEIKDFNLNLNIPSLKTTYILKD